MDKPPDDPRSEAFAAAVRGLLGAVPVVGSLLAEIANLYVNPLGKRKQRWLELVAEAVTQIQKELGTLPQSLQENEEFVSFLYQATQIALRNHQKEKLNALRGALVSIAHPRARPEDEAFLYLRYIDELSASHLRLLATLDRHAGQISRYTKLEAVHARVEAVLEERIDRAFFRAVLRDLESRTLILMTDVEDFPEYESTIDRLVTEESKPRPLCVTSIGRAFLSFIHEAEL